MTHIQVRRDVGAIWTSENPVLMDGEIGYDKTAKKVKIGDGVSSWTALPYVTNEEPPPHANLVGEIKMWATNALPQNHLWCDGSTFSAATYPALYAVLGTTTLPSFNGRTPVGVGTADAPGAVLKTVGEKGGEEKHLLTIAEMPSHTHQKSNGDAAVLGGGGPTGGAALARLRADGDSYVIAGLDPAGGGQAHNNMPPYIAVRFIIRARA